MRRPAALEDRPPHQRWLVRELWGAQAVGIIGGEPKCGKSFLALDFAVSVAAGVPCLRRFESAQRGPVALFAAEDAGHIVRSRLEGIAQAAGADFEALDIAVIDTPTVRLDRAADRTRLRATVAELKPRLLILDPFVRLHSGNENDRRGYGAAARVPARAPAPFQDRRGTRAPRTQGRRHAPWAGAARFV